MAKKAKKSTKARLKSIQAKGRQLETQAVAIGKKADSMARKNPWALAGIAAGLGMLIGFAGGQTRKKKR